MYKVELYQTQKIKIHSEPASIFIFDRSFLIGIQRYQLRNDRFKPEALPGS
jgi:hypothetical protein